LVKVIRVSHRLLLGFIEGCVRPAGGYTGYFAVGVRLTLGLTRYEALRAVYGLANSKVGTLINPFDFVTYVSLYFAQVKVLAVFADFHLETSFLWLGD
jgi:hypothetical protein